MSKTAVKTSRPKVSRVNTATGASGAEKNSLYYVVYVDTYVNDTEILPRGVYVAKNPIKRLDASQAKYVRKFTGTIPDKIVHEIAETLKVSLADNSGNYRPTQDILDEIVQVI